MENKCLCDASVCGLNSKYNDTEKIPEISKTQWI